MPSQATDHQDSLNAGNTYKAESEAGITPSHGISIDLPEGSEDGRPPLLTHL